MTILFNRTETLALPVGIARMAAPLIWRQHQNAGKIVRERSVPFDSESVSAIARIAPVLIGALAIALSIGAFGVSVIDERQRGLKNQLHIVMCCICCNCVFNCYYYYYLGWCFESNVLVFAFHCRRWTASCRYNSVFEHSRHGTRTWQYLDILDALVVARLRACCSHYGLLSQFPL